MVALWRFNPRTYIRYDGILNTVLEYENKFQSTYLYKVRRLAVLTMYFLLQFQSTYLYKVRHGDKKTNLGALAVSIHVPI